MLTVWQKDKFLDMGYDPTTLKHRELLVETIEKYFPFETILDVGCATGADLSLIEMVMPTTQRTGFDVEEDNVTEARQKLKANIFKEDLRTHLENIPDKSFDVVFSNGVIMYIQGEYQKKALENMLRIAKKAVILSEKDTDGKMIRNFDLVTGGITIQGITDEIRQSWTKDGFIYEILPEYAQLYKNVVELGS